MQGDDVEDDELEDDDVEDNDVKGEDEDRPLGAHFAHKSHFLRKFTG